MADEPGKVSDQLEKVEKEKSRTCQKNVTGELGKVAHELEKVTAALNKIHGRPRKSRLWSRETLYEPEKVALKKSTTSRKKLPMKKKSRRRAKRVTVELGKVAADAEKVADELEQVRADQAKVGREKTEHNSNAKYILDILTPIQIN